MPVPDGSFHYHHLYSSMHEDMIEHIARDDGYNRGYEAGKTYTQSKVLELMDEVIEAYGQMPVTGQEQANHKQVQSNAVRFMKNWVLSGGHTDFDGNRSCLPW